MAGGYLGTLGVQATFGEPISWPFEIGLVILPFILFTSFYAIVLERWRRDRVEMKTLRNQLSYFALTDPLTDLPNRRHFDDYLQQHSALCSRLGTTYAVGLIDVDDWQNGDLIPTGSSFVFAVERNDVIVIDLGNSQKQIYPR